MFACCAVRCGDYAHDCGAAMKAKIKVLEMIAEDMRKDAENFDGRPFNGKTVAEYFGNHGAAIAALANIVRSILEGNEHI